MMVFEMAVPIETAGKHAAAVTAVVGLGILVSKPIRGWRQRRKAERKMILDALEENSKKLDGIKEQMGVEYADNKQVHGRIEEKIDALARHTRLVMSASINIIDALMQHDSNINGTVKEYRKSISDAMIDGMW